MRDDEYEHYEVDVVVFQDDGTVAVLNLPTAYHSLDAAIDRASSVYRANQRSVGYNDLLLAVRVSGWDSIAEWSERKVVWQTEELEHADLH